MRNMVLITVVCLLLFSCDKNKIYQAEGTLEGVDLTMCPCCGGIVVTIDNKPGNYRIDSLPFMSRQQLNNLNFPKRIKFNFHTDRTCGSIEMIQITEFIMH